MRRLLFVLLVLGVGGTLSELCLLGHWEDAWQWIPVIALSGSFLAMVTCFLRPGVTSFRLLRFTMVILITSGFLGLYLHYRGNMEFELEMYPAREGLELVWETLTGATPALAPAAMVHLGLIGLGYCYRHPVVRKRS